MDRSFQRFGAACALVTAAAWLIAAVLLYTGRAESGLASVFSTRVHTPAVNYVLAIGGLALTAAIAALHDRLRMGAWANWALGLGMIAGVLTAIQCLWNATRYAPLRAAYDTGEEVHQIAVSLAMSTPNPVDPRGFGSQLLLGICLVVAGWLMLAGNWPRWLGGLAMIEGICLALVFFTGLFELGAVRTVLAAVAIGALGPVWWLLAALELWRGPAST